MAASRALLPTFWAFWAISITAFACGAGGESSSHGPSIASGPPSSSASSSCRSGGDPASATTPASPLPLPPSGKHIGATVIDASEGGGVEFRVWAPNAKSVFVVHNGAGERSELAKEDGGFFAARIANAHAGETYGFEVITASDDTLTRTDPRARAFASNGQALVIDPRSYAWKSTASFASSARERTIVYEMHIGSFHAPGGTNSGTFVTAAQKLDALADLGVGTIELMPINVHGSHGWGYNPQAYFAPHTAYGSPDELRAFVDAAHARGIAVVLDVVFNHYDNYAKAPMRCFDGLCPDNSAGVYFFDADPYKKTPWGPRPDYAKHEVSDFFADNVFAWMKEYRIDGFRQDSVSNIRAIDGKGTVPGGSEALRRVNEVAEQSSSSSAAAASSTLLIAEDLKGFAGITEDRSKNGLGFDAQWDGGFHWAITSAVSAASDDARDLGAVRSALLGNYNGDPFQRLLYVESHDTAGNDGARLPSRIDAADPTSIAARRRTMLAAGLLLTAPGVPMLFMGQEMLESTKFVAQPAPLDWTKADTFSAVRTFHRDLIRLRRNTDGVSSALAGTHIAVTHVNDTAGNKVIAYRRWSSSSNGGADDMIIIANFGAKKYARYDVGLPGAGAWVARIDGDHVRYGADFGAAQPTSVVVSEVARDGLSHTGSIVLGPYSIVVLGR